MCPMRKRADAVFWGVRQRTGCHPWLSCSIFLWGRTRMARGPKKQRLNICLIKPGVGIDQVVRDGVGALSRCSIRQGLNFSGVILTKGTPANPPSWIRFVQQGVEAPLGLLFNQSA